MSRIIDRATAVRHNDRHFKVIAAFNGLPDEIRSELRAVGLGGPDRTDADLCIVRGAGGRHFEIPVMELDDEEFGFDFDEKREVAAVSYVPVSQAAAAVERTHVTTTPPDAEKADAEAPPADVFRVETDPKKVAERYRVARAEAARKAPRPKPLTREQALEQQKLIYKGLLRVPAEEQLRIDKALAGEKREDPFKVTR